MKPHCPCFYSEHKALQFISINWSWCIPDNEMMAVGAFRRSLPGLLDAEFIVCLLPFGKWRNVSLSKMIALYTGEFHYLNYLTNPTSKIFIYLKTWSCKNCYSCRWEHFHPLTGEGYTHMDFSLSFKVICSLLCCIYLLLIAALLKIPPCSRIIFRCYMFHLVNSKGLSSTQKEV